MLLLLGLHNESCKCSLLNWLFSAFQMFVICTLPFPVQLLVHNFILLNSPNHLQHWNLHCYFVFLSRIKITHRVLLYLQISDLFNEFHGEIQEIESPNTTERGSYFYELFLKANSCSDNVSNESFNGKNTSYNLRTMYSYNFERKRPVKFQPSYT